jgi:TldD protein
LAEPYTGPAILYSHAAGVFFHEIFGHRVEGHRFKDQADGQTFQGKVQEQVLPATMSITFDPTRSHFQEQALNGYYKFDDEGIEGRKVKVVDKGVLKTFLMSRTPIKGFEKSNGHARTDGGAPPVSRQSNLIIESEKLVEMADLRKMLISECKKQKKKYGYLFMDVMGGFTTTDRFMPNAFNIFPTEVYRVYTDGRPDELVRGVDLIGTPLAMFAEIKAAGDKSEVFTGFCGAESGSIPVTAISPSLFVKRIETQKKPVTQIDKTLLPMPDIK